MRQGGLLFGDITHGGGKLYDLIIAYCASNVANVQYTQSLAEKVKAWKVIVLSLNPSSIKSPYNAM